MLLRRDCLEILISKVVDKRSTTVDFLAYFYSYSILRESMQQRATFCPDTSETRSKRCWFHDAHPVKFAISRLACHDGELHEQFCSVEIVFPLSRYLTTGLCFNIPPRLWSANTLVHVINCRRVLISK